MLKKVIVFLVVVIMAFPSSIVPVTALTLPKEAPFQIAEKVVSSERSWKSLGDTGLSLSPLDPHFSIDVWDDKIAVAVSDKEKGGKATVYQNNGTGWAAVGISGFSQGVARRIQMDIYEGVYYVAYSDESRGYKPTVMKYDSLAESRWVNVGDQGFSRYGANLVSLQIYEGTPYIALAANHEIVLMKFNGTSWEQMGNLVLREGIRIPYIKLSIDEGVPYIAWKQVEEGVYGDIGLVAKYRDNQLAVLGEDNNPAEIEVINWFDFCVDDGISYLALIGDRVGQKYNVRVLRHDENYWLQNHAAGQTERVITNFSLYPDGEDLYLAFNEISGVQVRKFSGNSWDSVGTEFPGAGDNFRMAVEDGTPYIAYLANGKISAAKYGYNSTGTLGKGKIELSLNKSIMKVNGLEREIDPGQGTKSEVKDGNTFLPLRSIIEAMGGSIGWNGAEKKVNVECNGVTLEIGIGSTKAEVDGVEKTMDAAPYTSKSGRTMMPLRFVAENLGCQVGWDGGTKTVTIQYEEADSTSTEESAQSNITSWTGVWDSLHGTMLLTQSGNRVTGVYESDDFAIEGTANGATLTGTFQEYDEKGSFKLVLSPDGTFRGERRYQDDDENAEWSGSLITDSFGSSGTSWGGVWYTDYGPLIVTQTDTHFTGIYQGTHKYTMEGTVSGKTVTGRIREGDWQGDLVFTIADDGESFTGKWHYDGEDDWTEWSGIKER